MREFRLTRYATIYSAIVHGEDLNVNLGSRACFAKAFSWLRIARGRRYTATYKVIIYSGVKRVKELREDNACLLSHKELRNHIDQLKGIVPFECRIRKKEIENYPAFEVLIKVNNGTILQHKYILAWIRYAYEYPFNVTLMEANRLRHEKEFKFMSGFNLFNLVGQCFNIWEAGHSIAHGNVVKLMPKNNLKRILENKGNFYLNDIFECSHKRGLVKIECESTIKDNLNSKDIEFWNDDILYIEERLPIYKKRLKYLRRS